ncbi:MAG: universal stress protein [Cyanobacteria bacterium P01_G01_bin.39]
MSNKILVALDLSDASRSVFNTALFLAQTTHAQLVLLQIIPSAKDESLSSVYEESRQRFKQRGLEALQSLAQDATTAGVNVEFTQDLGNPGRTICDFAQTRSVDTILVGSRGLTGAKEMLLGSVSNYVTHHAPCSVLIVREILREQGEI